MKHRVLSWAAASELELRMPPPGLRPPLPELRLGLLDGPWLSADFLPI